MSYAVIAVPHFALHALRRHEVGLANQPVALIEGEGRKAVVVQASPEAQGIEPGLAVTIAMARCPGVVLRLREPQVEVESRRLLIAAAFSVSPRVELTDTECCTIDLQGTDHGLIEAILHRLVGQLASSGLPAVAGVGDTPLLALYASRCAKPVLIVANNGEFLRELPLTFAGPNPQQAEVLRGWGIHTLGQLASLPKAEVGRRLGTDGVALLERATGESTRVLRHTPQSTTFSAQWVYEPGIENIEPLFFKLRRYAECLSLELRGLGFVAESLGLTLLMEDETDHRREFRLAQPGADVESWLKVLHAYYEGLRLPSRVVEVHFVAKPARPELRQDGLFDAGLSDPHSFWENLARVEAIIGKGRVGTPQAIDTWKPDAFTMEKPLECVPAPLPAPVQGLRGGVLRRFRPPRPVIVAIEQGAPIELRGAASGVIRERRGPWRTSGGWWLPEKWAVETWHVEMENGQVLQLGRTAAGWAVEGEID